MGKIPNERKFGCDVVFGKIYEFPRFSSKSEDFGDEEKITLNEKGIWDYSGIKWLIYIFLRWRQISKYIDFV